MPYGPWDEYFVHQLPRPLDTVHNSDPTWSDRCYFSVQNPEGTMLVVTGYGINPNTQRGHGYAKIAFADGRHIDLDCARRVVDDRGELYAGPMRWTCVEPLKRWTLTLGPNDSGLEYELHYESRAPMWELLPIEIRKRGRTIVDMTHMKQSGRYSGWVKVGGEEISVDGFLGGRDRTFGVRMSDEIDFWIWLAIQFEDCSLEAYVFESRDGTVNYLDGGVTFEDGRHSHRFVSVEHDLRFDGARKRPASGSIVFTDTTGARYALEATADHQHVTAHYGLGPAKRRLDGSLAWYAWDGHDAAALDEIDQGTMSLDQLMRVRMGDREGHGIVELFAMGDLYERYPNWRKVDARGKH
jgi:hypothetical protein